MKKIFVLISLLFQVSCVGFSEDFISIGSFTYKVYNNVWKNFTNYDGYAYYDNNNDVLRM